MSPFVTIVVSARRLLVRRPWVHWLIVVTLATGAAASMLERADRVDAAREAWGATARVWVATKPLAPGDPIDAEAREVPMAVVPPDPIEEIDGLTMRQHVGAGEMIAHVDVVAGSGPQALIPRGWLAVPLVESPSSGAAVGARVQVASDGIVISADALVVGRHDDVTVIAVPAIEAALVPAAAEAGTATVLLVP